ncbi:MULTISPECIES: hypothetical protein [unclassified Micromonospora]|uniref:hypothetical protein n=1 Tax=unclassified Micromonospora TaxID=2617518 RepID=UPI001053848C|nr:MULTISPECIES: hypothetical protein [unclassified Micromonospora]TDB79982.1 hypothetical protein E1182_10605 [Micromonospora sp. KC721]TDC41213.1 hypothetical protein E1166_12480 [Micromonospora sp. KC213]
MNEPVASDTYAAHVRRLAELTGRVATQRAEAQAWYDQQCAAAERAVAEADEQLRRAEAELAEARSLADRVDAEVTHLWAELRGRLGLGARRLGPPPGPARDATGDPVDALRTVRDLLDRAGQPGELPGSANPLLALCGVAGALLAYALGVGARAVGARYGGDLAVGMPVLALVVTLLGPLAGLAPAKRLADRRHALLGPRPAAIVLVAGLATTVTLLVAAR